MAPCVKESGNAERYTGGTAHPSFHPDPKLATALSERPDAHEEHGLQLVCYSQESAAGMLWTYRSRGTNVSSFSRSRSDALKSRLGRRRCCKWIERKCLVRSRPGSRTARLQAERPENVTKADSVGMMLGGLPTPRRRAVGGRGIRSLIGPSTGEPRFGRKRLGDGRLSGQAKTSSSEVPLWKRSGPLFANIADAGRGAGGVCTADEMRADGGVRDLSAGDIMKRSSPDRLSAIGGYR
jgi:hypothetical protein